MFWKCYAIALPVFVIVDLFWLGIVAKQFYAKQIGFLLRPDVNWAAAVCFYLIFVAGMVLFVIVPSLEKSSWAHALIFGGLFGLVTYSAYDLTNLATVKNWPVFLTLVDMIWGVVLGALVCVVSYLLYNRFLMG